MKMLLFLVLMLGASPFSYSQESMIVFFKDKELTKTVEFTERSIQRRSKNNVQTDEHDFPVNAAYVTALLQDGAILNTSRWLNAVSFSSTLSKAELLAKHDFISDIKMIGSAVKNGVNKQLDAAGKALDYGMAFNQIDQMNLKCLHDMGFTGQGIYIGIIDAGFINMDSINYFDSVYLESRVIDSMDFVNGSSVYAYSSHGTSVSSCIVAEKADPDKYAGAAVDADLALYVAEDVSSETEIEEFNVVAALERCDSVGVDVANISLGYFNYDDSTTSHTYAELDGQTTIAAIGVNVAFSKGIIVSVSAGNSGPSNIGTPCDADDGFCVGAVDEFGAYAFFSSVGPSADGQVKPDVASRGFDAWLISSGGNLVPGSGTSFSSPLMAGAIACLVQANPTMTAQQIMDAVRESANQYTTPDEFLGFGIPNFCNANDILSAGVGITNLNADEIRVYPIPTNDFFVVDGFNTAATNVNITLYNAMGARILLNNIQIQNGKARLDVTDLSAGVYTLEVMDGNDVFLARRRVLVAE